MRTVIIDEIHALVGNRRSTHLALSLARLDHVAEHRPAHIGLSATQKPIEVMAQFLVGADRAGGDGSPNCAQIDLGHQHDLDIAIEMPPSELEAIASHPKWDEIYERLAALIETHRTALIFVNTLALAERVAHRLAERIARILLARYGIVCRDLLTLESITLSWREIVRALRRFEARGDVRGGRFVDIFVGEQYALPEAVDGLRAVRRCVRSEGQVRVSAVDSLNLVGVIFPGNKVIARNGSSVTPVDGAVGEVQPTAIAGASAAPRV